MNTDLFVSGGISGAITDPDSDEAIKHAEKYYKFIRKSSTDVEQITQHTGFTYDQVLMVKNYLFVFSHKLEDGVRQFDPCFEIAESWRRLAFDPKNIQPHDRLLLSHELLEMDYVNRGFSQREAHDKTNEVYNYTLESDQFYKTLREKNDQKNNHTQANRIGGGISLGYNTH